MPANERRFLKIVMVGPSNTGAKTSVTNRFVHDCFNKPFPVTITYQFFSKTVAVDGMQLRLDIFGWCLHSSSHHFMNVFVALRFTPSHMSQTLQQTDEFTSTKVLFSMVQERSLWALM